MNELAARVLDLAKATCPPHPAMIQAKGSAANDPQVPGALGSNPAPNQVAKSLAIGVMSLCPPTTGAAASPPA